MEVQIKSITAELLKLDFSLYDVAVRLVVLLCNSIPNKKSSAQPDHFPFFFFSVRGESWIGSCAS
jgi:hypothetical protein